MYLNKMKVKTEIQWMEDNTAAFVDAKYYFANVLIRLKAFELPQQCGDQSHRSVVVKLLCMWTSE